MHALNELKLEDISDSKEDQTEAILATKNQQLKQMEDKLEELSSQLEKQADTPEGIIFQKKYEELKSKYDDQTNVIKQKQSLIEEQKEATIKHQKEIDERNAVIEEEKSKVNERDATIE